MFHFHFSRGFGDPAHVLRVVEFPGLPLDVPQEPVLAGTLGMAHDKLPVEYLGVELDQLARLNKGVD